MCKGRRKVACLAGSRQGMLMSYGLVLIACLLTVHPRGGVQNVGLARGRENTYRDISSVHASAGSLLTPLGCCAQAELAAEARGYTATKHQREVGAHLAAAWAHGLL